MSRVPITAAEVQLAAASAIEALTPAVGADWTVPAGSLEWTCRATLEHIASDLVAYAALLTSGATSGYPPFDVVLDEDAEPAGYLQVLRASAGILSAAVQTAPPDIRVWHSFGMADVEAVAGMGILEILLHTEDLCRGLALTWAPPEDLCRRTAARMFPNAPAAAAPPLEKTADQPAWATLLWATGRGELEGQPHQSTWRWRNEPL
jgi:uncharacterized protein (TIGR03083 family)